MVIRGATWSSAASAGTSRSVAPHAPRRAIEPHRGNVLQRQSQIIAPPPAVVVVPLILTASATVETQPVEAILQALSEFDDRFALGIEVVLIFVVLVLGVWKLLVRRLR
jgi:hypothetical protein